MLSNNEVFFESWVHVPHKVLGRELKPLSILHLIWLYNAESPLVITNKNVTMEDLEIAVLICSNCTNEGILAALNAKENGIRLRISNYFWRRQNRRKRSLQLELRRFLTYNDDFMALPKFMPREGESDEKLPWLLVHMANLIKATGWDEQEVLNMPIGKVLWYNLAFGYLETGETRVMSDREKLAADAIKELYGS